jgi:MFS family permease
MNKTKQILSDSPAIRWTALLLLALAMFFSYIFMDILSPVKSILEATRGWDNQAYGAYAGSETFLNVFIFFLIFAGIILDKMGVRFTAILSGVIMVAGATINWYAVTPSFQGTGLETWFNNHLNYIPVFDELDVSPFFKGMPASAKLSSVGFMIFGCGVEMAGITVSRGIVKWFKSKEMALAMGSEMALARLGVASCMVLSPIFAKANILGGPDVSHSAAFGVILLCVALIMFIAYFFMDRTLDRQTGAAEEKDDPFKISDIGKILSSGGFWLVALLCVMYYSAIFPFQKYAVNMLECNLGLVGESTISPVLQIALMLCVAIPAFVSNFVKNIWKIVALVVAGLLLLVYCYFAYKAKSAGAMFSVFPLLAVGITPILGNYIDKKGKAATMLILGSILLIVCHLTFAFILPTFRPEQGMSASIGGIVLAFSTILVLGASFSLVPASLWPSVPKLVDNKVIGSAYALIFWIQNFGLWLFPLMIGKILNASNPDIIKSVEAGTLTSKAASVMYEYTNPLIMLAGLGVVALILGFILKVVDKKKGLGLELPNIKRQN